MYYVKKKRLGIAKNPQPFVIKLVELNMPIFE